ncbi:MAG: error-prone DNA polymerase [bacterium]
MRSPYVELRAHSAFSFGDGAVAPEVLATCARQLGYTSLGLTDHGDLGGTVRFARQACLEGIRPIIGVELLVDGCPAAFLARTAQGYRNIAALVTRARAGRLEDLASPSGADDSPATAHVFPTRGRPLVTWADVAERSAGVHALTGPASGSLASALYQGRRDDATRVLARWRDVFGPRLAVEVQLHHAGRFEEALAGALVDLAEREGVAWIVAGDPRYVDDGGRLVHDTLTALRAGLTLDEAAEQGVLHPNDSWKLVSPEAMATRWRGAERGLEKTAEIAAECGFELTWLRPPLPKYPIPASYPNDNAFLREKTYEGARERWGELSDAQVTQLEHELAMIGRLGYAGFFLVMWDGVREAHSRNILCQGRGSAANSAVAYCLAITAVDPVRHGLLFERFLSDIRVNGQTEAPDIDVDVEHDRREEVLDYIYGNWRRENAAITGVVQMYSAPTAIQDAMRAYGYPPEVAFALSKRVHRQDPAIGAEELREDWCAEHGFDVGTPRGDALVRTVAAFEGLPRMRSTHPGGFVLSSAPLGDYCPIEPTTMGRTILQFDKDDLDAIGIPKFDFLGLGALAMIRRAFDAIEILRPGEERLSIYKLPQDDEKTFAMIARGDTLGTFQIESRAQIASLVHTRPERMYDIVVQVALIRPGPIVAKFVHPYTERRRGRAKIAYPPGMESRMGPVLDRTQGIPIFQEQAMALAMTLGGYTASEADELRRTMGNDRKRPRLIAALERLRTRMSENGIADDVATTIAEDLQSFANYGFPESHAWSFALIAYATAYLKAHEPAAFYAGLLNAWPMGFYSPATLVHDAKRHDVEVRSPCFVQGHSFCTLEPIRDEQPALRIGWRFIRDIGTPVLDRLIAARAAAPFTSIVDVVRRGALTRRDAAACARAGVFAVWQPDRRRAAWEALRIAGDVLPLAPARTEHDVDDASAFAPRGLNKTETIVLDYRTLGLSIEGHPMEQLRPWCKRMGVLDTATALLAPDRTMVVVAGLVVVRQRPQTAKGTVFLLLEDEFGSINVIVSRTIDEQHRELVRHTKFLAVYGRAERSGPLVNVIAQKFKVLDELTERLAHRSHDFR